MQTIDLDTPPTSPRQQIQQAGPQHSSQLQPEAPKALEIDSDSDLEDIGSANFALALQKPVKSASLVNIKRPIEHTRPRPGEVSESETEKEASPPAKKRKTTNAKETKKAALERERTEKKLEKERIKALKALEKENSRRLREANQKVDRKTALEEIILVVPPSLLRPSSPFSTLLPEIEQSLPSPSNIRCVDHEWHCASHCLSFIRRVSKLWDASKRCFVPLPSTEEREETLIVRFLHAEDLASKVSNGTLVVELNSIATILPGTEVYLFVLDFGEWKKRFETRERRNAGKIEGVRPREIEKGLMKLQGRGIHVIRTEGEIEAVRWIVELSRDLAHRPYRTVEKSWSSLMQGFADDQKKGGKDNLTIYKSMLSSIGKGLTDSVADSIASSEYSTLRLLMEGYDRCATEKEKELMLADIIVDQNRDGTHRGRKLGPAISSRIKQVFCETDGSVLVERRVFDAKK
ncbi:hypothetical protein BT69DRAFT_1338873 [Atractiella rhizophila]|nr:hypothetical protein BT69DRAFT_1338873 [Atractiella rhizophila]